MTIYSSSINHNTASNGHGGGVYSTLGSLTLDGCQLSYNHADANGGAIDADGGSTLTAKNCNIFYNTADRFGEAIRNYHSTATVTNSQFIANTAGAGGGICAVGGATTVDRCNFMNNRATGTGTGSSGELFGHGGAVYDGVDSAMTITYSTFFNNFASDANGGGAIYVDPTAALTQTGNYFAFNRPNNVAP